MTRHLQRESGTVLTQRRTGAYRGQLATLQAALERAKELRAAGMKTVVFGPDGKPIDETREGSHQLAA